jgi:hypothetical protein
MDRAMLVSLLFVCLASAAYPPIQVHPANPHYFLFRETPQVLVSATESYFFIYYGNLDFEPFLLDAASHGFNLARLFMLAPNNSLFACLNCSDYMTPWASVNTASGVKYNLSEWNPMWWNKLHAYLELASSLDIAVEISLLSQMYALSNWVDCPLYYKNNIQGIGNSENWWILNTMEDPQLLGVIDAFITQIITELNPYDNVYFELCNEPPWQTVGKNITIEFTQHELTLITKLESTLPYRHMLSFQDATVMQDPLISVYNWHFAFGGSYWTGAIDALNEGYSKLPTAIAFNEADIVYTGETAEESRIEGWEFIFGGGGLYNNLNYEYFSPQGTSLHTYLSCLLTFMKKFNFLQVHEDTSFVTDGLSSNVHFRGLVNEGFTYAAYFHHAVQDPSLSHYMLTPGNWQENITISILNGEQYKIQWIQPSTCAILSSQMMNVNKPFPLSSPQYSEDMALLITRF